ncbi:MAG: ABC transporter permease [Gammaproteobacteria bacterium]|nr:ABC transporter permease [Gammaproteobacteria bacterium]
MLSEFWKNRDLVSQMIRREVLERYRGSVLGLVWSFAHPLLMLLVYMFVFGIVFKIKWGVEHEDNIQFGVVLFAGLVVHALFTECLVRAPNLILSNTHFVKKVVFPLEVLAVVTVGTALFHSAVSLLILLIFNTVAHLEFNWTVVFLPLVLAPLILLSLGVTWFLASLGVFLRDVAHIVGILSTVLLFLSPIFYPLTAVPEALRPLMYLNPLTVIVEQLRNVVIWGRAPDWLDLSVYFVVAGGLTWFGYWWFQRTRRAFSDVL